MRGLALALSWLTVLPVRTGAPDARTAAGAIRWAPVVGGLLGAAAGGVLLGSTALGVPPLVAGLLAVGFLGLATRGMHLDGLADTADGLGCYGPPERALAVMRDGGAGPFGVVALIVALGVQAAALAAHPWLDADPAGGPWPALGVVGTVALAAAAGRAGFGWVCRRGVPAARPGGLGATVAGSQPVWVPGLWWLALAGAGFALAGVRGVVAVVLGAGLVALLSWHTARRFGGMTGDVLGAATELATTAALVVLATAP
ncbi:adenosylcobinamide-GDP ribazoletransferase [Pseudonocardia abyssalis]|uniref:Adenosylcobinamide-GDP ribazoletransferase n=1 Tax=Pseudonocardia abyssalis TaxID=2792008 RepID=A0ABS6USJ6_9PSEU|nr:adenosylcobinamide-GDP ribazoletransferase [Pseudonocardia abyssalis]MBW0116852.1 adenosylcobinamide-GDP ribazoletransferase [Pseudonocardia abyssalis]MBW0135215.1 adenosylcobinamide-GDP ribazoletransferase [Pseudonocardia abyssalis]